HRHDADYADYDGYSTDSTAWASPAELQDLSMRLLATIRDWQESIDVRDGQDRTPVFLFAHAFPSEP
ncbi:hypothetical protein, partial [Burkholderia sp. SIMBA_024]